MTIYNKLFKKNKRITILHFSMLILLCIYMTGYSYRNIMQYDSMHAILLHILKADYIVFVVMLFISYDYCASVFQSDINEVILTSKKGYGRVYQGLLSRMLLGNAEVLALQFLCMFVNAFFLKFHNIQYMWYSIRCILLYGFGVNIVAILYAMVMANKKKYWIGCILLLVPVFLNSTFFMDSIMENIKWHINIDGTMYTARRVFENFYILPDGLQAEENSWYHYTITYPHVIKLLFWIICMIIPISNRVLFRRGHFIVQKCVFYVAEVAICVVMLPVFVLPYSDFVAGNESWQESNQYYIHQNMQQKDFSETFSILSYEMEICINSKLEMHVDMTLTPNQQTKYKFTLSHHYQVYDVSTEEGKKLKFEQKGDYIEVFTEQPTQHLIFSYKGYSPTYYANGQGVCLPAYFCYYPRAGYIKMYNVEKNTAKGYISNFVEETTSFDVTILNPKMKYYSNLEIESPGHYVGVADGFSLFGGFICEQQWDGITFICATKDVFEIGLETMEEEITTLKNLGVYENMYIVLMPYGTCKGMNIGKQQMFFSSIFGIDEDYQKYLDSDTDCISYE